MIAMKASQEAQRHYKEQYDKTATSSKFQIGDWVLVHFAHQETGKMRKLSQPWHGSYRIVARDDPDVTVKKVYFPDDPQIQIHLSRIQPCLSSFPQGFFWYGRKRSGPEETLNLDLDLDLDLLKWIKKQLEYITNSLKEPRVATTGVIELDQSTKLEKPEGNYSENQITVTTDMNEYQGQNEGGPKKTGKKGNNLLGHITI